MPFDIPHSDPAPPVQPFDVALKELVEALGAAPAAQALVEGGASPREAVQAVEHATEPRVTDVTVVEFDADVIALVGPTYDDDPRLTIVHADAFTYEPPPGRRYAMVWHDIWDRISASNLASMALLMRKFEPIADWQGCWAEDQSVRRAAQEAANTPAAAETLLRYLQSSAQPLSKLSI
jgi:hypothetical protein